MLSINIMWLLELLTQGKEVRLIKDRGEVSELKNYPIKI